MWYAASIDQPAAGEPISLAQARAQCGLLPSETFYDERLKGLIRAARAHIEQYCSIRLAPRTMRMRCDAFSDFARLPEAPVQVVTGITFLDPDGEDQTVAEEVYELRDNGLEAAIVLRPGRHWPAKQSGTLITVTAKVGFQAVPDDVAQAMLLFIGEGIRTSETAAAAAWTNLDSLLCNHRRGV